MLNKVIKWGIESPRRLIVADLLGATLSLISLTLIWFVFESLFDLPKTAISILITSATLLLGFDLFSLLSSRDKHNQQLQFIGIANVCYCVLSLCLAIIFYEDITLVGHIYLLLEILLVFLLAMVELKVVSSGSIDQIED